jgi:hypothetical protein
MVRIRLLIRAFAMLGVLAPALGLAESPSSRLQPVSLTRTVTRGVHKSHPIFTPLRRRADSACRAHSACAGSKLAQGGCVYCAGGAICCDGDYCCGNGAICCASNQQCMIDDEGTSYCE